VVVASSVVLVKDLPGHSACGFRDDKTVTINGQKLNVEVASTDSARVQGLSSRKCIGQNEAMLFVFNQPGYYQFWMKDMNFPIDIIWISPAHKAIGLERKVQPSTYPTKFVNQLAPAQYVLEMASGRSTSLGMTFGTIVNF
jgi:uncharacterized membrane protein (UPF0127 family)